MELEQQMGQTKEGEQSERRSKSKGTELIFNQKKKGNELIEKRYYNRDLANWESD